jgi:IS4 transposase
MYKVMDVQQTCRNNPNISSRRGSQTTLQTREDIEQLNATRTQTERFSKEKEMKGMAAMSAQIGAKGWYIDSGATKHMTSDKNW